MSWGSRDLEPFGPLSQPCNVSSSPYFHPVTPLPKSQRGSHHALILDYSLFVTAVLWGCVWSAQACHVAVLTGGA